METTSDVNIQAPVIQAAFENNIINTAPEDLDKTISSLLEKINIEQSQHEEKQYIGDVSQKYITKVYDSNYENIHEDSRMARKINNAEYLGSILDDLQTVKDDTEEIRGQMDDIKDDFDNVKDNLNNLDTKFNTFIKDQNIIFNHIRYIINRVDGVDKKLDYLISMFEKNILNGVLNADPQVNSQNNQQNTQ